MSMSERATPRLDPREEHYWVAAPRAGLRLFVRRLPAARPQAVGLPPVLYVHGATFPSALSIAHRFDGYAWRDALCEAGFDVWAFDFLGFGSSDRYPEMQQPPGEHPPLGRAPEASEQLEAVVRFILDREGAAALSIISHSWGSMPVGRFAGRHPTWIDRLVWFAPITRRPPRRYERAPSTPTWRIVTLEDQWARFVEDVPPHEPPVLSRAHFAEWGERYLDSDPGARRRTPVGVQTPTGPFADILHAWHGELPYDPGRVQAPVAIIRGAWDGVIPDEDARWLFEALTASSLKRDIKIGRGSHLMHLEAMRYALYRESIAFLLAGDEAPLGRATRTVVQTDETRGAQLMATAQAKPSIPGYTFGTQEVAQSPISLEEWDELKKSALFSEEDVVYMRLSEEVLADQVDALLKVWRGIIFDHPHLRAYDEDPKTHQVDTDYAQAVGKRFGQWVRDTARAQYDQAWLDYQYEIGLRHHRSKKNQTDGGHTLGHIRARDLLAFCAAIVVPMRPFLAKKGHAPEIVNRMYDAWWKSMILQATLWVQPYIREGDF
jgi:pimeloyl-ACP methyl ester carboxylesterase